MINININEEQIIKRVEFPVDQYYKEFQDPNHKRTNPFCAGFLKSVSVESRVQKDYVLLDGVELEENVRPTVEQVEPDSIRYILSFVFESKGGDYTHTEEIWDGDLAKSGYVTALNIGLRKISQIMAAYVGEAGTIKLIGAEGLAAMNPKYKENWESYFGAFAKAFNTGKNGKPVFINEDKEIPVRFKLTRQVKGKNPNRLQLSANGNCIERISSDPNRVSILAVTGNDSFELIEKPKAKLPITSNPTSPIGGSDGGDSGWPDVD